MDVSIPKKKISLAVKLNLLTISLILATSAAITIFNVRGKIRDSYRELLDNGKSMADMVSKNSEYGIYAEDREALLHITDSLAVDPDIVYVSVINSEKKELARRTFKRSVHIPSAIHHRKLEDTSGIFYGEFTGEKDGQHYIEILAPVRSFASIDPMDPFLSDAGAKKEPRTIGYVRLGLNLETLHDDMRRFLLSTLLFTTLFVLLGAGLTIFITRRITSPIKDLQMATKGISEGKLDHHMVEIKTSDEISDLARSFGHMLERLRAFRDQVEERTSQLIEMNLQMAREINDRKHTEKALADEKEQLSVTLRSIGDGVITTDREGVIFLMNKVAEDLTGYRQEEARGKPLTEIFRIVDRKTREGRENPVAKVLETDESRNGENHPLLIARDGTERIIADSGAPIRDREGNITGVVLVFRDITEKLRTEGELQKIEKLESIGVLAGGIAHDFNNLLTAIIGNIALAKMDSKQEETMLERLKEAERAALRACDLTQQLLTFSKGGVPIKRTATIVDLIKDSSIFVLRGSNVKCLFDIQGDLWPVEVDEGQINQVINNLIINASQAMPQGGTIKVRAGNTQLGAAHDLPLRPGRYVKISIQDQGVGIPKENLDRIFEPYFTTKAAGSGLGLATVYSIVTKHDGYITVESEPDSGSVFHIYLPAAEKELPRKEDVRGRPFEGRGRVLVMDDEESVRNVAGALLQKIGYEVDFAGDGEEAIEIYRKARQSGQPFDAVIMDLTIPGGVGGKEAIERLLEIDHEVRAIVSSGYCEDPIMSDFRGYGFRGVLTKPYRIEELKETLRRVISGVDDL